MIYASTFLLFKGWSLFIGIIDRKVLTNSLKFDVISFYKHVSLPPVIGIKIVPEVLLEELGWIN